MWRYWKNKNVRNAIYAGIFTGLAFYFKVSALLVPMIFIMFIIVKDRIAVFKDKGNYYYAGSFLVSLIPYFIYSYINYKTLLGFTTGYSNGVIQNNPFEWGTLGMYQIMTQNLILFILFLIGLVISLKFLLYLDIILKDKEKKLDSNIFCIIALIVTTAFYIFYIRSNVDDRWVFIWLPFIFFYIGQTYSFVEKRFKKFAWIMIVIILIGGYLSFSSANSLINVKESTYLQVKEAAIWMKDNSAPGTQILSISYPQTVYYSERNVTTYSGWSVDQLNNFIKEQHPEYITVSGFEVHPPWIQTWIQENQNRTSISNVYYVDASQQQPILIVYKINY